jgi:F-type H+-transporting ATPase subunit epsilon
MQCDIVTQERTVFSAQVNAVNLPGTEGRMGILPNHSALLTTLGFGEVIVRPVNGDEEYFAIGGGFAEIQPHKVIVLADSAESADEINIDRAEQARQRAEQLMKEGIPEDPERYAQIQASLLRAQIRLDVGRRRAGHRRAMATGAMGRPPSEEDQN